jgi:hypothetical protein
MGETKHEASEQAGMIGRTGIDAIDFGVDSSGFLKDVDQFFDYTWIAFEALGGGVALALDPGIVSLPTSTVLKGTCLGEFLFKLSDARTKTI